MIMKKRTKRTPADSISEYIASPEIALLYDRHYENTPLLGFDTHFIKEVIPPAGRLLDVGCGTGRHILELAPWGLDCVGVDLSEHMLEIAREKCSRAGIAAPLVMADMTAPLPFCNHSFDHVICMFSTIGLIPTAAARTAFLVEVSRILKPSGNLVLHVHNRLRSLLSAWGRSWLAETYLWNPLFRGLEAGDRIMDYYRGIDDMYLHIFSLREIRRLLTRAGFAVRRIACLNDTRNGELENKRFASIHANGFLIAAQNKPPHS